MKITRDVYLVGSGQIGLSDSYDCHVYLVDCGDGLVLIDAGAGLNSGLIIDNVRGEGFDKEEISCILLTHCHADHAGGCSNIKMLTSCKVICTEVEGKLLTKGSDDELGLDIARRSGLYPQDYKFVHAEPDQIVIDGEKVSLGKYDVRVIEVPGHSEGSTCYLLDQDGYRILFSSDIVFYGGTIGLGNWPGSSLDNYRRHIGKLANLSVDALLPGHFLWTLKGGQEHLDRAADNLKSAWVPPAWQHQHHHY